MSKPEEDTAPRIATSRPDTDLWPEFVVPWNDTCESATDMSFLLHKPAGGDGFIQARDGHFFLPSGERWKIWGQNITLAVPCPPVEAAAQIARRMAKFGINCLRLHHIDHRWPEGILMRHSTGTAAPIGRDMGVPWDGRGETTRVLDPEAMARMDWFIHQCKLQGIYIDFNLNVSRIFTTADGVNDAELLGFAKGVTYFNGRIIELQKEYARELLGHVNPFTGTRYADEPAIALVEILNENSLLASWHRGMLRGKAALGETWGDIPPYYGNELRARWNEHLLALYGGREALLKAWNGDLNADEDPRAGSVRRLEPEEFASADAKRFADETAFYQGVEQAFFKDMNRYLREELGVKQIVVGTSDCFQQFSGLPMLEDHALLDAVDGHAYWQGYWETPDLRRNRRPAREWYSDWYIENTPMIEKPDYSLPALLSRSMVKDKPYIVSEINHHFPGDFNAECFPVNTAYALLQDWDGIFWFGYAGGDWEGVFDFDPSLEKPMQLVMTQAICRFEWMCNDPMKMTQSAACALMFLRGDISAAKEMVERGYPRDFVLDSVRMHPGTSGKRQPYPYSIPYLPGRLGLVHRTAIGDFHARQVYPGPGEIGLPTGSVIESDTGELAWNDEPGKSSVCFESPRHRGVVMHRGIAGPRTMRVELEVPFAALQLVSLEDNPIAEAERLLLVAASRVANTGMKWADNGLCSVADRWGGPPTRIEAVSATITLSGLGTAMILHLTPLDGCGRPAGEKHGFPIIAGTAVFHLGDSGTAWYLVELKERS